MPSKRVVTVADIEWAAGGSGGPLVAAAAHTLAAGVGSRAVVLVEGISDQVAVEALAVARGRDLAAEGIAVLPIGGATSIGRFLGVFGPQGADVAVAGLCDAAEEGSFRRGLERAGMGTDLGRDDLERLGFFVCVDDLEDELIRALGTDRVVQVIEANGDLRSWQILQRQPAQQGRGTQQQLRRFMGTTSGRKIAYGRHLVEALDAYHVLRPLDLLLAYL
jgi:hypothetical protein